MGYRSDVSVAFYSRNTEHLPFASLKFWFDETYHKQDALEWDADIETGDDFILITYTSVKWYPNYRHVKAVRTAIDKFDEAFDCVELDGVGSWEVVEVGEELDDCKEERSGYSDYRLGVRRDIVFS